MSKLKNLSVKAVVTIILLSALAVFLIFSALTAYEYARAEIVDVSHYTVTTAEDFIYHIGSLEVERTVFVRGWLLKQGEDIETANYSVIFQNTENDTFYRLKTQCILRGDVTEYVDDGHNYNYSGFQANPVRRQLEHNAEYRVWILYMNNGEQLLIPLDCYFEV